MDRRYQVKQFLGECRTMTRWGTPTQYRVFACGDEKWFLFDPIDEAGCSRLMQFPVLRSSLRKDVRAGLSHGMSFTSAARNEYDHNNRERHGVASSNSRRSL
jgi:hypothetical protein